MADKDVKKKLLKLTGDYKKNAETLNGKITASFSKNMDAEMKNYVELQHEFMEAYTILVRDSMTANHQFRKRMDKSYESLKEKMHKLKTETAKKAAADFDRERADFEVQVEKITSKYPALPEAAIKDTMKIFQDSKARADSSIKEKYDETVAKLDENYAEMREELHMNYVKRPEVFLLDIDRSDGSPPASKKGAAAENKPGTSKS